MRIAPGAEAISFEVEDIFGQSVRLEDFRDRKLLLSFYRYASCPLCNLRIHELTKRSAEFEKRGLSMVAFFQSPAESIRKYVSKHEAPFPIIPDPEHNVYNKYGVESSVGGFLGGMLGIDSPKAMLKGFLPGKMEGTWTLMPADFLIGPDLKVQEAFYGNKISEHLPFDKIDAFLNGG